MAYAFNQYHLISAPVVDEDDRLVGVITIDDAMAVLDEEAEEDLLRLAGVGDERVSDRTLKIARQRFPWLFVNLATAILASLVISQFEAALTQVVALAVLMPIVASMGGNAGTQSLTVAVRALATRDLTGSNAVRALLGIHDAPESDLRRRVYQVHGVSPPAEEMAAAVLERLPEVRFTYKVDPARNAIVRSWPFTLDDSDSTRDWGWKAELDLAAMTERMLAALTAEG